MSASQFQLIFGVIGWWAKSGFASISNGLKLAGQKSPILFFHFTNCIDPNLEP